MSKEENAGAPRLLRVMSYNILGGRNRDESHNLRRVADVIAAARPDIVALQEVDVKTKRSRGKDIPADLAEMLGMHHSFGRAIDHQGGQYGNGVLSRFPIAASHTHALAGEGGEDRCGLECMISIPGLDHPLSFVSLHLDHKDGGLRARQLARLHRAMAADGWSSRILAGDFNDEPDSDLIKGLLADGWTDLAPASHRETPTVSSDNPRIRIDYLIARAPFRHRVVRYAVGAQIRPEDPAFPAKLALASDHLPVFAEIALE
jgi:endonuclease/exonuclease/phosphatase family metal-dependent hydrolase